MTPDNQRRRFFIDRPIQLAVIFRTMMYWALCTMAQLLMVLFFAIVTSSQGPHLWWHLQISFIASAVLLPIILLDVLRLSHRWVGPIFRLRACLKSLSRGESVAKVRFRKRDFWQELASDLNGVATELERRKAACSEDPVSNAFQTAINIPSGAESNSHRPSATIAP